MTQASPAAASFSMQHTSIWDLLGPDDLDFGFDADGGNPYSPIWICGLEFGGGFNDWLWFERHAVRPFDLSSLTSFVNRTLDSYEYAELSTALVLSLADDGFREQLGDASDPKKAAALCQQWGITRRATCWGGYGFRMNAGIFSRTTHSASATIHLSDGTIGPLETVLGGEPKGCLEKLQSMFARQVKERLARYRPKLVICTGRAGFAEFRKLFLDEDERQSLGGERWPTPKNHDEDMRIRVELYLHKATNTYVVLGNFLTSRRNSTIGLDDIPRYAKFLREQKELEWLKTLPPSPKAAANAMVCNALDALLLDPDFSLSSFVEKDPAAKSPGALAAFRRVVQQVRPAGDPDVDAFNPSAVDCWLSETLEWLAALPSPEAKARLKARVAAMAECLSAAKQASFARALANEPF